MDGVAANVPDEVYHVAATYTTLGAADLRLTPQGQLDNRLTTLYCCMSREDPNLCCVKPLPLDVLHYAHTLHNPLSGQSGPSGNLFSLNIL
jgi:hypothetical protein